MSYWIIALHVETRETEELTTVRNRGADFYTMHMCDWTSQLWEFIAMT